ncbi:hypothetical protein IFM51744_04712 [Aspergillus udagawae]|nr:hypothetical protein IFM51744_04712 [Aspergillus udagawae]
MHAPIAASDSGGRRPDRGKGGRRPHDRGPGKVMKKKKKKEKRCRACGKRGHNAEECRLLSVVFSHLALATTRAIATQSSRSRRPPLGPSQQHPRMNSRQRRTARRLAEQALEQLEQQAQEQLGRQQQSPQE